MALPARTVAKIDKESFYTVEEFEQLPEFGERYDLVEGKLVKRPMPGGEHGYIADLIRDAIKLYDPQKKFGYSLQEVSVRLGPRSAPTPDISYWKAERKVKPIKEAMPMPDLAIEIHSPGDTVSPSALQSAMLKVHRLVSAGVPIVWAVNSALKTVEIYHAGQPDHPAFTLSSDDELDGEDVIPGFKLKVDELFDS